MPRARQASPMPRTASPSCHMISGRSGLPKLRLLVRADRLAARARDVARRFGHGQHRTAMRIEIAEAAVAIDRDRQAARRVLDADDRGRHARLGDGVGADGVVVLAIGPPLAGDGRRRRSRRSNADCADGGGPELAERRAAARACCHDGSCMGRSIHRRFVGQRAVRHVGHQHAALVNLQARSPSVTSPTCTACRSHFSNTASTSCSRPFSTTSSMRSCDSDSMIS